MNEHLNRFILNIQLQANTYLKELLETAIQEDLDNKKKELNQLLLAYATNLNDSIRVNILKTQGYINALEHLLLSTKTQRKGKPNE